jgi:hypothetical protein
MHCENCRKQLPGELPCGRELNRIHLAPSHTHKEGRRETANNVDNDWDSMYNRVQVARITTHPLTYKYAKVSEMRTSQLRESKFLQLR